MLFDKCSCCGLKICVYCIQLTVICIAVILGGLVAWKPKKVIEIQMALYRFINWKMEPVSMEKEIRNTRIMGVVLLIVALDAFVMIRW